MEHLKLPRGRTSTLDEEANSSDRCGEVSKDVKVHLLDIGWPAREPPTRINSCDPTNDVPVCTSSPKGIVGDGLRITFLKGEECWMNACNLGYLIFNTQLRLAVPAVVDSMDFMDGTAVSLCWLLPLSLGRPPPPLLL
jgi:hypothetical protein